MPRKLTPQNDEPRNVFERTHTGDDNYRVQGEGGKPIWADGIRTADGWVLEAKRIGPPDSSPYVPDSSVPAPIRRKVLAEAEGEIERYGALVRDPDVPVRALEIVTNEPRAVVTFERLLDKHDVPGRVVVRPDP